MCDYSLQHVQSRPASVGDKLTTKDFGRCTKGFAASEDANVAVCVLPGTEIAFSSAIKVRHWGDEVELPHDVAIFRQKDKENAFAHHDALEFPDGSWELLTALAEGQTATVLQLPAAPQTADEAKEQERVAVVA